MILTTILNGFSWGQKTWVHHSHCVSDVGKSPHLQKPACGQHSAGVSSHAARLTRQAMVHTVGGGQAHGVGGTGQWCQGDRPVVLWGQAGAGGQA